MKMSRIIFKTSCREWRICGTMNTEQRSFLHRAVEKSNLTMEEAAAYSGIGINKLRSLSDKEHCQFVLWVGSKRLIKRRKLDEYTERMYSL